MSSNVTVRDRGPDGPSLTKQDSRGSGSDEAMAEDDPRGDLGSLTIADKVVEKVVTQAIREVSRAGGVPRRVLGQTLGNVRPDGPPRVSAKVDGSLVVLDASISVEYPQPIREVTAEVRSSVVTRCQELLALEVVRLDIDVPHLYSAEAARPAPERVQ